MNTDIVRTEALKLFKRNLRQVQIGTDRIFFWLLLIQWISAIAFALIVSPYAWAGKTRTIHLHVELAVLGGAALNILPFALMRVWPGRTTTRHVIAVTQMLWAALFVHLSGGRIETHFFIFGSLAFLAFYRDPRVLITATATVAMDHLLLGFYWPESVYGIANPEWWRFLEHAGWVVFEVIVLIIGCQRALREMHTLSDREATLDAAKSDVERQVMVRTEELKASSDRYKALIENTSAMPWEIDGHSGVIVYLAPQASVLLSSAIDPVQAMELAALFHPEDREPFREFVKQAMRGGCKDSNYIDVRIVGADRKLKYVRNFLAERPMTNGSTRICGISIDITQQRRLELELLQAQKMESIGQLAAGIAHELNTPAQFIGDNVHFLQESLDQMLAVVERCRTAADVDRQRALSAIEIEAVLESADFKYLREEVPRAIAQSLDGIARITNIVGAMKEFSHPAVDRTYVDINRAILSTITVASNEWKYVAEVSTDLDARLSAVPVMPGAFNQVILNLLINAAHAVAEANVDRPDAKGSIMLFTRETGAWAEIIVADTGCGIAENIRARIFEPFFTTKQVGKGTGQGLAIAHDIIVKKHGGTIAVESEVGVGTRFVIRLPLEVALQASDAA
jgi:PAS domain S-box-containing protein